MSEAQQTNNPFDPAALVDAIGSPVIVIQPDGKIIQANQLTQRLTGYTVDMLAGRDIWTLLDRQMPTQKLQMSLQNADQIDYPYELNLIWQHPDGNPQRSWWSVRPVRNDRGAVQALVLTGPDERLVQISRELKDSANLYRKLVETMQDGFAILDDSLRILHANAAFHAMLGQESGDIVGKSLFDFIPERDQDAMQERFQARRQGKSEIYEQDFLHRGGQVIHAIVAATPLFDRDEQFVGSFGVITDITERKAIEAALRVSNAELDAFAHTVAHDLKGPISILIGYANLLEADHREMTSDEMADYLHAVTMTADKMLNIVDELLLLSQIRHVDIQLKPLDHITIVHDAIRRVSFLSEQYDAEINTDGYYLWPKAKGHAAWVEEVWVNYISNAIKYGGVPPKIKLGADQLEKGMVRFWVEDNGKGIPASKRSQLFTPFTRLDQVRAQGYGLGLSIVQRIVNKLGGTVGVENGEGRGSRFYFTLPAADA